MPIYEYQCKKCNKEFELLVFSGETPECPYCKHKDLTKKISIFNTCGIGPKLTSSSSSATCNTCSSKNCSSCK